MLNTMTPAERAYFARRLPRSFERARSVHRASDPETVEVYRKPTPPILLNNRIMENRLEQVAHLRKHRAKVAKAYRIARLTSRQRQRLLNRGPILKTNLDRFKQKVVRVSGHEWSDIVGRRRFKPYILPRHAAMYLLVKRYGHSLPSAGKHVGNRDHSTVLNAIRNVEADPEKYAHIIKPIEQELGLG